MDPITHVLAPLLWTEPVRPPQLAQDAVYARWRERAAVVLGALLPDADGAPGLLETFGITKLPLYTEYHRCATHSVVGLCMLSVLGMFLARKWPEKWMLPALRTKAAGRPIALPSWRRLFAFVWIGLAWHIVGDGITAWGTLKILWPFASMDFQLRLVNSIEPYLLTITLSAWAVQQFALMRGARKAAWTAARAWLATCVLYVLYRVHFGPAPYV
jgi:membrane-bound metal-dependent hydrolase YbcI (DUF457 family)